MNTPDDDPFTAHTGEVLVTISDGGYEADGIVQVVRNFDTRDVITLYVAAYTRPDGTWDTDNRDDRFTKWLVANGYVTRVKHRECYVDYEMELVKPFPPKWTHRLTKMTARILKEDEE